MATIEMFAVLRFGPEAAFTPAERMLAEPSLARIIERYGALAERYSALLDPILLGSAALLYALRLARIAASGGNSDEGGSGGDKPPEPPEAPRNGTARAAEQEAIPLAERHIAEALAEALSRMEDAR
jgi:hypothetical protein